MSLKGSLLTSDAPFLHFFGNRADTYGGAISAQLGSSIAIREDTTLYFRDNAATYGGAMMELPLPNGHTFFEDNNAVKGGALNIVLARNMTVSFQRKSCSAEWRSTGPHPNQCILYWKNHQLHK